MVGEQQHMHQAVVDGLHLMDQQLHPQLGEAAGMVQLEQQCYLYQYLCRSLLGNSSSSVPQVQLKEVVEPLQ